MTGHGHEHDLHHSVIFCEYLVVAVQFLVAFMAVKNRTKAHWGMFFMVCIFTLCGVLGYVAQIFTIPSFLHVLLLNSHIIIVAWFIYRNNASIVVFGIEQGRNKGNDRMD